MTYVPTAPRWLMLLEVDVQQWWMEWGHWLEMNDEMCSLQLEM